MKVLLIFSMLLTSALASEAIQNSTEFVKCKIKAKNGIVKSYIKIDTRKAGLRNYVKRDKLTSRFRWASREYSQDYIKHITAKIGSSTVLNLYLSPHTYYDPTIIYNFEDNISNERIVYSITNSLDTTTEHTCKVKRINNMPVKRKIYNQTNSKEIYISPKAWEATSVKTAIKELFPKTNKTKSLLALENKMHYINTKSTSSICIQQMNVYNKCFHDYTFPLYVNIRPKKELEFIAILSSATPKSLLAIIVLTGDEMIDISIPFQLEQDGELFLMAKGNDGILYRTASFNMDPHGRIEGDRDDTYTKIGFDFDSNPTVSKNITKRRSQ